MLALSVPVDDLTWAGFAARLDAVDASWPGLLATRGDAAATAADCPHAAPIEDDLATLITAFAAPVTTAALEIAAMLPTVCEIVPPLKRH